MRLLFCICLLAISILGCDSQKTNQKKGGWLEHGSSEEKFKKVSKHLRGFDMAMVETGYRYTELYWAGKDQNWGYAAYQAEKIETAIKNGIERRPKRAKSAQMIFPVINEVKKSIAEKDLERFNSSFNNLTQTCNACHVAEKMSFVQVRFPQFRLSPVQFKEKK